MTQIGAATRTRGCQDGEQSRPDRSVYRCPYWSRGGRPITRAPHIRRFPATSRPDCYRDWPAGKAQAVAEQERLVLRLDAIARSLKHSADNSTRRKAAPFRSAMSMLVFYINRAGKSLDKDQLRILEQAKEELRSLYGKNRSK